MIGSQRAFGRASEYYHQRAAFQRELASALVGLMPIEVEPKSIFEFGCGTGFVTDELIERALSAEILATDVSVGMIEFAQKRIQNPRVSFRQLNILDFEVTSQYDLIVSGATLQWVSPLSLVFNKFHRGLKDDGLLLCSVMTEGTYRELHQLRAELFPHLLVRRALPTAEYLQGELQAADFKVISERKIARESHYSSALDFIRALRCFGLTSGELSAGPRTLTRGELAELIAEYDRRYSLPVGGICASLECYLFVAQRN